MVWHFSGCNLIELHVNIVNVVNDAVTINYNHWINEFECTLSHNCYLMNKTNFFLIKLCNYLTFTHTRVRCCTTDTSTWFITYKNFYHTFYNMFN